MNHREVSAPLVSIIVPAYNEEARMPALLELLTRQDYPAHRFEVIIADNGSSDRTAALVKGCGDERVRLVEETLIKSPDAARNKALAIARGSVLAFTDADCRPGPEWLSEGVSALSSGPFDLAAGRIDFCFEGGPGIAELYDAVSFLQHDVSVSRRRTAFTANLFVTRAVFDRLGPFDVVPGWNGDSWFTQRAVASGHSLGYAPDAVIQHPARRARELARKIHRIGAGQGAEFAAKQFANDGSSGRIGPARRRPLPSFGATLASKPQITNLRPRCLAERLESKGFRASGLRFASLLVFAYGMILLGGASFLHGYGREVIARGFRRRKRIPRVSR